MPRTKKTDKTTADKEELLGEENNISLQEESGAEELSFDDEESGAEISADPEETALDDEKSGAEVSDDEDSEFLEDSEDNLDEDSDDEIAEDEDLEDHENDLDEIDAEEDDALEELEEDDSDIDTEEDLEEYAKMREDLLKEYDINKAEPADNVQDYSQESSSVALENLDRHKVSSDEDLEIEDVEETIDGNVISKPKTSANEDSLTPDVDQGVSKVALSKGSSFAILGAVVLVLIFIIYKMFQPSEEEIEAQKSTINKDAEIIRPVEDVGQTIVVPEVPKFPDMPQELTLPAPKALPTPPVPATLDLGGLTPPAPPPVENEGSIPSPTGFTSASGKGISVSSIDKAAAAKEAADAARKKARIKSSMMVGGGGGASSKNVNADGQSLSILQRNTAQTVATHIGELQRVIAAGKVIDAVLETAVNTDLPGLIRAIVSRDVYSEAGNNVLITKGSRLIGSYSSEIKFGQARVQIAWDRVIRPDGIDIKVASPGIDDIGRSGSAGDVDNHILRNFATAMMVSMINVAVAEYAEKNGANTNTTQITTNTDGSSTDTSTESPVDQAYDDAVDNISSITTDVIEKTQDMPPTITIDQGTSLKVFIRQDLIFPGRSANLTRVVE